MLTTLKSRLACAFLLLAAGATCGSRAAQAQSIYGPGGLFLNPTADFPEKGRISPAALELQQKLDEGNRLTWTSYSLDYGLTDRWEVGATYLKINPGSSNLSDGSQGLYAKFKVMSEIPRKRPALAVGGNFLTGGDADARTAFAALRLSPTRPGANHPLTLHLGAIYIDELDGQKHRELAPYGGASFGITRHLSTFAEVRARLKPDAGVTDGTFASRSIGLVWKPVQNYKLVVVYGSNGWNDQPSQLGVGVGYSLPSGRGNRTSGG